MCGLAGYLFSDWDRQARPEDIQTMVDGLIHRGPDDQGIECLGPMALGHRRLSIIDLSPAGRQPMSNEDGRIWLVCNGEIYNHNELREALRAKGHSFRSQSDSEVILHLYEEYGDSFVSQLRGMFAFAIWDSRSRRLVLGRDRLGQKPLFYRDEKEGFLFASEALPLHKGSREPLRFNKPGLIDYLSLGYFPSPSSAILGTRKLEPGCLLVKEWGQAPVVQSYWTLDYGPKWDVSTSKYRENLDLRFLELFDEATRMRQMADVSLGAFLSGGVDSSAVVSSMSLARPQTFSIGFQEKDYDERPYARLVAERYQTVHREMVVEPDAVGVLETLVDRFGEPFADSSAIPCYYLAKLARGHVTVALSGDGADELFGGYMQFVANELALLLDRVPAFVRQRVLGPLVAGLPTRLGRDDPVYRLKRFMAAFLHGDRERRPLLWSRLMVPEQLFKLLNKDLQGSFASVDPSRFALRHGEQNFEEEGDRALHMALRTYLPDDLLTKVDITSMAHGLETRAPFLDHKLVEFVARLPLSQKVSKGQTKRLLKRALLRRLPRKLLYRKKKGFAVPIDSWFRGRLNGFLKETLLSSQARSRELFSPGQVEKMILDHEHGKWNHQHSLWSLLCLELWFQSSERHLSNFAVHN